MIAAGPFLAVYWERRKNRNIQYDWQRAVVSYNTDSYRRNILARDIRSKRTSAVLSPRIVWVA